VTFTRGFVTSQAFVDRFGIDSIPTLLPAKAEHGLDFVPSFKKSTEALDWMGFEARSAILEVLDEAIADKKAKVRAVLYDLNEPGIVSRLEKIGKRLKVIIDDDGAHGKKNSPETAAAKRLAKTAGAENVMRQHMGKLQHNKIIVVDGPKAQAAICGSTNHSWRGFFVQNNNAIVIRSKSATKLFMAAFEDYFNNDSVSGFGGTSSARWNKLGIKGIDAEIGFSPRSKDNAVLQSIADDISDNTASSLFFSLAFLYQTKGAIQNAVKKIQKDNKIFSYGISDHEVKSLKTKSKSSTIGVAVTKPDGKVTLIQPEALRKNIPEPFKSEPVGGGGTRMHHKFIVIDFDKPTARVYMGSYNFSNAADTSNGENLLVIRDRRIAVSYVVEAVRLFDHYHFRVVQAQAKKARKTLELAKPPRKTGEKPWWTEDYTNQRKILDRELFA
jgi:phosphatidylserine/phosphatidylglycerophosphate/cardiolipin synthase-like enzyme